MIPKTEQIEYVFPDGYRIKMIHYLPYNNEVVKKYKLLKKYEDPCGTVHIGVIKDENQWMGRFALLNPGDCDIKKDWFEEVKEKFWEIISYGRLVNGHPKLHIASTCECEEYSEKYPEDKCPIFSVKRLPDHKIFSVGDSTNCGKIREFSIKKEQMRVYFDLGEGFNEYHMNLDCLTNVVPKWKYEDSDEKSPKKEQKYTINQMQECFNIGYHTPFRQNKTKNFQDYIASINQSI